MRISIISAVALLLCATAFGQSYKDDILNNPDRAGGNYHYYEAPAKKLTPAPKGYKPFYISHYARHGSRWHSNDRHFKRCIPQMEKCDSAGLLSNYGKALLDSLRIIESQSEGKYGMLTQRGAQEHRDIAARMCSRFPEIFSGKVERTEVRCASSKVPRCIISMSNFAMALQRHAPDLSYSIVTGDVYHNYIAPHTDQSDIHKEGGKLGAKMKKEGIHPERFINEVFTDWPKAKEYIGDAQKFMLEVYSSGATGHNTVNGTSISRFFTTDELVSLWMPTNDEFYYSFGISANAGWRSAEAVRPILQDILRRADDAVRKGSHIAGDFRFGHDTYLLPLAGYLGIEGISGYNAEDAHKTWQNYKYICMASNLQIVFYRNKADDILVKVLYNENECAIKGLEPVSYPYYRWEDFKDHLVSLISPQMSFIVLGDIHYCESRFYALDSLKKDKPSDFRQITGTYSPLTSANWKDQISVLKDAVKTYDPAVRCVVQLGDVSEGLANKEGSADKIAENVIARLEETDFGVPWILVKGNHDVTGVGSYKKEAKSAFRRHYSPFIEKESHSKVSEGNYVYRNGCCLFVALDPYNKETDQVKFAKEALTESDATFKFVILHEPIVPVTERCWFFLKRNEAEREELLRVIAENKAFVLCGHLHKYSVLRRKTEYGPVVQVMLTSVTDMNRKDRPSYQLVTENYGESLIDRKPDFSLENEIWRREVLRNESRHVDFYKMNDLAGYGIITVDPVKGDVRLDYYAAFSHTPYDSISLTGLQQAGIEN